MLQIYPVVLKEPLEVKNSAFLLFRVSFPTWQAYLGILQLNKAKSTRVRERVKNSQCTRVTGWLRIQGGNLPRIYKNTSY